MSAKLIELRAHENELCHDFEASRRAQDTEGKLLILEKLTHNIRLQSLEEEVIKQSEIEKELR